MKKTASTIGAVLSLSMASAWALVGCKGGADLDAGIEGFDSGAPKECDPDPFTADDENCTIGGCHAGMENPHPYGRCEETFNQACSNCHGGQPNEVTAELAHVPPPPNLDEFNHRTLAGLDTPRFNDPNFDGDGNGTPDVPGMWPNAGLDWLRFHNPGDLRIASATCGGGANCHVTRVENVKKTVMATSAGILSGTRWDMNFLPLRTDIRDTKDATEGTRAVTDATFTPGSERERVRGLTPLPDIDRSNPAEVAAALADGRTPEDLAWTDFMDKQCGDCHLNMAGANNRRTDFRSSGCTTCHMPYADDGRYLGDDPTIDKTEPVNPDAPNFAAGERAHPMRHTITTSIPDITCDHCHFGSNRTVLSYHGERVAPVLNNNQAWVAFGVSSRANLGPSPLDVLSDGVNEVPGVVEFTNRIADGETEHGFARNRIIRVEDWNGDGFDDTPPDIHFERGLGCVDCHMGKDVHGDGKIYSRMYGQMNIECVDCHGTLEDYSTGYKKDGERITNLEVRGDGVWLTSRLDGRVHFVVQTKDLVNPMTTVVYPPEHDNAGMSVFNFEASVAMGREDADVTNGYGPRMLVANAYVPTPGFSHLDGTDGYGGLECATCHSAWKHSCQGCHAILDDTKTDYSNATGRLGLGDNTNADFTWVDPTEFHLGVGNDGQISIFASSIKTFFRWKHEDGTDEYGGTAPYRWFETRDGTGYGTVTGGVVDGGLGEHAITPHTIRGTDPVGTEGVYVRNCTGCHLDATGSNFRAVEYTIGLGPRADDPVFPAPKYAVRAWDVYSNSEVVFDMDRMITVDPASVVSGDPTSIDVNQLSYDMQMFPQWYIDGTPAGAGYSTGSATPGEPGPFGSVLLYKLYYGFVVGDTNATVMVNDP